MFFIFSFSTVRNIWRFFAVTIAVNLLALTKVVNPFARCKSFGMLTIHTSIDERSFLCTRRDTFCYKSRYTLFGLGLITADRTSDFVVGPRNSFSCKHSLEFRLVHEAEDAEPHPDLGMSTAPQVRVAHRISPIEERGRNLTHAAPLGRTLAVPRLPTALC